MPHTPILPGAPQKAGTFLAQFRQRDIFAIARCLRHEMRFSSLRLALLLLLFHGLIYRLLKLCHSTHVR